MEHPPPGDKENLPPHLSAAADTERTARHLRMLQSLAEWGMAYAEDLHRTRKPIPQAAAGKDTGTQAEPSEDARTFAAVTRTVQRCITLEAALVHAHRTRLAKAAAAGQADARKHHLRQKELVRRLVTSAAIADPETAPQGFAIRRERAMDDDDLAAEFLTLSLPEIAARICRDLDIDIDPPPPAPPPLFRAPPFDPNDPVPGFKLGPRDPTDTYIDYVPPA